MLEKMFPYKLMVMLLHFMPFWFMKDFTGMLTFDSRGTRVFICSKDDTCYPTTGNFCKDPVKCVFI